MDLEGLKAEVIIVNTEKDKTLSMLQQLIVTLVKGLNSNPAAIVKKIAGLVRVSCYIYFVINIICQFCAIICQKPKEICYN